jgi:hypothetical protein
MYFLITLHSVGKFAVMLKEVALWFTSFQCWGWVPSHAVSLREVLVYVRNMCKGKTVQSTGKFLVAGSVLGKIKFKNLYFPGV